MTTVSRQPHPTVDLAVAAALAGCAAASAAVPDPHATPGSLAWRWVVRPDCLQLYAAEPDSPDWRATCLGAGGALHRARVALAAEGLAASVSLLPSAATPDAEEAGYLARLETAGTIAVTEQARQLYDATDAATDTTTGTTTTGTGTTTGTATDADPAVPAPARAPNRAAERSLVRSLMRELVGAARAEGSRLRLVADGDDLVGVLHGPDTRQAWLRAGAALSAVRLTARGLGLSTVVVTESDRPAQRGRRRVGDREGWLGVGIGTLYARLRLTPRNPTR